MLKALNCLFAILLEHSAENELKREALHNRRLLLHLLFEEGEKAVFYILPVFEFMLWKQQFVIYLIGLLMLFL